jgi:hypothetical protein
MPFFLPFPAETLIFSLQPQQDISLVGSQVAIFLNSIIYPLTGLFVHIYQ